MQCASCIYYRAGECHALPPAVVVRVVGGAPPEPARPAVRPGDPRCRLYRKGPGGTTPSAM